MINQPSLTEPLISLIEVKISLEPTRKDIVKLGGMCFGISWSCLLTRYLCICSPSVRNSFYVGRHSDVCFPLPCGTTGITTQATQKSPLPGLIHWFVSSIRSFSQCHVASRTRGLDLIKFILKKKFSLGCGCIPP